MKHTPSMAGFAAFISLFALIACGKADMGANGASTAQNTPLTEAPAAIDKTQGDDDTKLSRFSTSFNITREKTTETASAFNFKPANFNATTIDSLKTFYNFSTNVDATFGQLAEFLFSQDLTFNNTVPKEAAEFLTATRSTAISRLAGTSGTKEFPVFRSTYLIAYAIKYAPKDKMGIATLREGIRSFAVNAAGFKRVSYTIAESMGVNPQFAAVRESGTNSFVEGQIDLLKREYEAAFKGSGGGSDAENSEFTETVTATWPDIEKSLKEFYAAYTYRIEDKDYYPVASRENGKIEFSFVPIGETGTTVENGGNGGSGSSGSSGTRSGPTAK